MLIPHLPREPEMLLRKRRILLREFREAAQGALPCRVAVLSSYTTQEVVGLLELHLVRDGFAPVFWQADYNRYFEDAVLSPEDLMAFDPDVVLILTSSQALQNRPPLTANSEALHGAVASELQRFRTIWDSLLARTRAVLIQTNTEPLEEIPLGNLDAVIPGGSARFAWGLNEAFAQEAQRESRLVIQDLASVVSRVGADRYFDPLRYHRYKIPATSEGSLALAQSLAAQFRAIYGRSKKCLVLDLDNTLWGGVIGDDGLEGIRIGKETPEGEAYSRFQAYCLRLHARGVLLAVCSKNQEEAARKGFAHPDTLLRLEHFAAFRANWEPKSENIAGIARELNLGLDSFVFVDDNPAERAIVSAQLPTVAVPDVGSDVTQFIAVLEQERYFETISLSREDLKRTRLYQANAERTAGTARFATYGEYLDSLHMKAEIGPFKPVYLERISQLINKTNQFNLTTRRYTQAEVGAMAGDPAYITLYGRLEDDFGDNGLVSVIIGSVNDGRLDLDTWLMSCRVLKRDMELAMLDALVERAGARGISRLRGLFLPTEKNGMVADHYAKLGFQEVAGPVPATAWELDLSSGYTPRNLHIQRTPHD